MSVISIAPRAHLWSVQYLRAIAALGVLQFHQLAGWHAISDAGRFGVDLFFVISGFIMVSLTRDRSISPGRFFLDRATRIVPLYWFGSLLVFIVSFTNIEFFGASRRSDLLVKSLFFVPSYNDVGMVWPTLTLGWTLNFEMFFYATFALMLLLRPRRRVWALGAVLVLLVVIGGMVVEALVPFNAAFGRTVIYGFDFDPGVVRHHPFAAVYINPLLIEFLIGAALGHVLGSSPSAPVERNDIGKVALVIAIAVLGGKAYGQLYVAAGVSVILVAAIAVERSGRLPRLDWLKALGDASFSIYLFQEFAFVAVKMVGEALYGPAELPFQLKVLSKGTCFLVAISLGLFVSRYVEKPLTRLARRWLVTPQVPTTREQHVNRG